MSTIIGIIVIYLIVKAIYTSTEKKHAVKVVERREKYTKEQEQRTATLRFLKECQANGYRS